MTSSTDQLDFLPVPDAALGAFVEGFVPGLDLDPGVVEVLRRGLDRYGVLIIRGQTMAAAEFVALGRSFGELEILPEPDKRDRDHPEIFNLTNVGPDGQVVSFDDPQAVFLRGTERWHTDSSFRQVPCLCTMLYAVEVPSGEGQTEFADMRTGYESLPSEAKAAIEGLEVVHSYEYSRANNPGRMDPMTPEELAKYPPVTHPLVRTHADGRRSLYLGGHASHVDGRDVAGGRRLLEDLLGQATDTDAVYQHQWMADDLVIWDNRTTLHRLLSYDIANRRRVMRRLTVAGTESVV